MRSTNLAEIRKLVSQHELKGKAQGIEIRSLAAIHDATEHSLVWLTSKKKDKDELLRKTVAKLILCDPQLDVSRHPDKTFIVVENPKLTFVSIMNELYTSEQQWGRHPSAVVDDRANIHANTWIGPFSVVGNVTIGEGTVLHGHNHLYDNVNIGKNVVIHSHVTLGSDGFGFLRNKSNELEKFLHIGCTVIEDDVEIYPYSNVDRGTLSDTRIKAGAKIDHYCHIGHNSQVGKCALITAGVVLCGGSRIGTRTWVGVHSVIKEKVKVGDDCMIGLSSTVTKDVPDGQTFIGSPAVPIDEFQATRSWMKSQLNSNDH